MFTVVDLQLPSSGHIADTRCGNPRRLVLAMDGSGAGAGCNISAWRW